MPKVSFGRLAAICLASAVLLAQSAYAQSVEFRIAERSGVTVVDGPASAQLNLAVQARVVNGPSNACLSNFNFHIRIVGEPENGGTFNRMLVSNLDGTYAAGLGVNNVVGRGGIANTYSFLARINASFNGVYNSTHINFTNSPDQEIHGIVGAAQGAALLGTPGVDADGDGIPDSSPSNGGTVADQARCAVPVAARADYLGASGTWIDVYRFRYTLSKFHARTLTFALDQPQASICTGLLYNIGLWGPCTDYWPMPTVTNLSIVVNATGAAPCCDPTDNSCTIRPLAECITQAVLTGSSCAPLPCPALGSCCDVGGCRPAYAATCLGTWTIAGMCTPNPCPPMGACCASDGTCTPRPQSYCPFPPGRWQGGVCTPNPCPQIGACCPGVTTCWLCVQPDCSANFVGPGTTCAAGGVCVSNTCCDTTTRQCWQLAFWQNCVANSGSGVTSLGIGFGTCSPNPCPVSICCSFQTGSCTLIYPNAPCSGYASAGESCSASPCPISACCDLSSGLCTITGFSPCLSTSTRLQGQSCTPSPCATMVCCDIITGWCYITGPSRVCSSITSTWTSLGSGACTPNPCPTRACCNSMTGACTVVGPNGTCGTGTTSQGLAACTPSTCPVYLCCAPSGQCSVLSIAASCPGNIAPSNAAVSCSPSPCLIGGQCCRADGGCSVLVQSACIGMWTATPNPCRYSSSCPPKVPCCSGTGQLTSVAAWACTGVPLLGFGCTTTSCAEAGACCTGRVCSITFSSGCSAPGAIFSPLTACTSSFGLCCRGDFDRSGSVNMADVFAFLSAWMTGDVQTDFDHDGQLGPADVFAFISAWSEGC